MNTMDEQFSGLLVDASDGHGKRYQLLSARMPLTVVAHILPGRRVVVRPTLGAIGSISARYHGADACLNTAALHPYRSVYQHNVARLDRRGRLGVSLKSAERCCEHANGHRRNCP